MIVKTTKIEELRYFSPFVRLKDQYTDLITSDVFFCDLNQQQQLFLYMASSEDIKVKATSWIMLPKNIPAKRMYFSKKQLDQKYSTCITLTGEVFTSPNAIKLNNRLERLKEQVEQYIKTISDEEHNRILYEFLDNINERSENKKIYKNKIPYVFYLQEVLKIFRLFNEANNKQHIIFDEWKKIFKFENDTELFNFQGCLGLLLMDEFCRYYQSNQLKYCILCSMLMTNLCIYSPVYKRMEREKSKELYKFLEKEQKTKADRSRAGSKTKNEAFKQWCINCNEKKFPSRRQKALYLAEYYQEHYKEIIKEFPDTSLTQEDPFNSIYGWLKSK